MFYLYSSQLAANVDEKFALLYYKQQRLDRVAVMWVELNVAFLTPHGYLYTSVAGGYMFY